MASNKVEVWLEPERPTGLDSRGVPFAAGDPCVLVINGVRFNLGSRTASAVAKAAVNLALKEAYRGK